MRRRHPQDWELRDPRFEELDSEDEDEDEQGVILDPSSYFPRDARARGGFASDELYFDGYDIGQDRLSRRAMYDRGLYDREDLDSDELEYRDQRSVAYQTAVRDKEEQLIESAMARIARARAKGKTNVNLSPEEMEALERRRGQPPEQTVALVSPPPTPTSKSASKPKASSRSNSSTSLAGQKTRKRGNTGLFSASSSPAKSNSKAKVNRKASAEQALPLPPGQAPPGTWVPGPNGAQVYAPIGYYGPPSPEIVRSQPSSRSGSKHRRRESTPPERAEMYAPYPPRYYPPPSSGMRPESSGSNRSLPDDVDWYPPPPRNRASSNQRYGGYYSDYDMAAPPLPAAQGRRNVSGPADVRYASLRRVPPSSSPLAQTALPTQHSGHSDPIKVGRKTSGLSRELDDRSSPSSPSSSSDDQGVQVEIVPDAASGSGYTINRSHPKEQAVSGNEGRRRKGGRK